MARVEQERRSGIIESIKRNKPRAAELVFGGLAVWYTLSALESFSLGESELGTKQLINAAVFITVAGAILAGEKILGRRKHSKFVSESPAQQDLQLAESQVSQISSPQIRELNR